jgi:hypothetical protein
VNAYLGYYFWYTVRLKQLFMSYIFSLISIIILTVLIYTQQPESEAMKNTPRTPVRGLVVKPAVGRSVTPTPEVVSPQHSPLPDQQPDRISDDEFPFLKAQSSLLRLLSLEH